MEKKRRCSSRVRRGTRSGRGEDGASICSFILRPSADVHRSPMNYNAWLGMYVCAPNLSLSLSLLSRVSTRPLRLSFPLSFSLQLSSIPCFARRRKARGSLLGSIHHVWRERRSRAVVVIGVVLLRDHEIRADRELAFLVCIQGHRGFNDVA